MADLDDFFAKKDRKKSKGKKFLTTEEIAKKLEETGKKTEKSKKEKTILQTPIVAQDGDELIGNIPEDEEWKDFEEEKKDYTGLKIQNLTIQDLDNDDNNDGENEGDMEENEQGEMVPKKKGPWKVIDHSSDNVALPQQAPKQEEKSKEDASSSNSLGTGKSNYVPPHLRNQQQVTRERPTRSKPGAPDITNQEYFPTLSAANNESVGSWSKRKQESNFEEARNSKSHSNRSDPTKAPQTVQIGNKFGALEPEHN